jgi:hypothetical protein
MPVMMQASTVASQAIRTNVTSPLSRVVPTAALRGRLAGDGSRVRGAVAGAHAARFAPRRAR